MNISRLLLLLIGHVGDNFAWVKVMDFRESGRWAYISAR